MATNDLGTITVDTTQEMVMVVAGLVREGVTFRVKATPLTGVWLITLTGGY